MKPFPVQKDKDHCPTHKYLREENVYRCQLIVFICSKKWFHLIIIVYTKVLCQRTRKLGLCPLGTLSYGEARNHINNDHRVQMELLGFLEGHRESEQQALETVALGLGNFQRDLAILKFF